MISAIRKTGFVIPSELAGKLGELEGTAAIAADRLQGDAPHLAHVLLEWSRIIRNLQCTTYFEPAPVAEQIEVTA